MIAKTLCLGLFAFALVQATPVPEESKPGSIESFLTGSISEAGRKTKAGIDTVVNTTNAGIDCVLHPLECAGKVADGSLKVAEKITDKAREAAKGVGDCVADKLNRGANAFRALRGYRFGNGIEGTGSSDNKVAKGRFEPAKDSLENIEKGKSSFKDFLDKEFSEANKMADEARYLLSTLRKNGGTAAKDSENKADKDVEDDDWGTPKDFDGFFNTNLDEP